MNADSRMPGPQTGTPQISFDDNDFDASPVSGLQSEEYVRLNNPGSNAVDISGWTLNGGISHTFKAGTVIPAGGSLFVVADVVAFQARSTGPTSGQQLFIQGNYNGNISNLGETIELRSQDGTFVDDLTTPASALTPNQEFLRISEINYHPVDSIENAEYIEFLNTGSATLDLSGVSVTEGPSTPFVFPAGTMLDSGERILIVQDSVAFANAYPSVPTSQIAGVYSGKLSNAGENVRLEEPGGELILQVEYGDGDPWHFSTDGEGQSLQLVDELNTSLLDVGKYYTWRASYSYNGTPGQPPLSPPSVVINEVLAHTDLPLVDSVELFNPTGGTVLIGGLFLSDSADNLLKYEIPAGTTWVLVDEVVYDDRAPWAIVADGDGPSLNRVEAGAEGTAADNWIQLGPTPGDANVEASVVTQGIFYNNSDFDNNSGAANADDDFAFATSKKPLLIGETATFENYSNYVHGINGLIIDVFGLQPTPTAADFEFRIGTSDDTSTWAAAPDPASISVRPGDGAGVADRVTLTWADGEITNTWLEVRVAGNGVSTPNVFYFGNVIGETGNDPGNTFVNASDIGLTRSNLTGFFLTDIDNPYDFDRNRRVNASDIGIARSNLSGFFPVSLITPNGAESSLVGSKSGSSSDSDLPTNPDWVLQI